MKKLMIVCLLIFSLFQYDEQALAATQTVTTEDVNIELAKDFKSPITPQAIEMQGVESAREFYYTLTSDQSKKKAQTITFQISNSELLISPSSFTVKVDDVPIKSVPLNGKKVAQKVKINLPKSALKEGTHKITVNFYGIVKEGLCVAPGKTGNWLRIEPMSSIPLFTNESWTLNDYPNAFLSYETRETTVIIPDESSRQTYNYAYQLAAYISELSEKNVNVAEETKIKAFMGQLFF